MRLLFLLIGVHFIMDSRAFETVTEEEEDLPTVKNKRQLAFGNTPFGAGQQHHGRPDMPQHNYHNQQQLSYMSRPPSFGSPLHYHNVINFNDPALSVHNFTAARILHPLRHGMGLGPSSVQELSMYFIPHTEVRVPFGSQRDHQHLHEEAAQREREEQAGATGGSLSHTGPHTFPNNEQRNNDIEGRGFPAMPTFPQFPPMPVMPHLPHFGPGHGQQYQAQLPPPPQQVQPQGQNPYSQPHPDSYQHSQEHGPPPPRQPYPQPNPHAHPSPTSLPNPNLFQPYHHQPPAIINHPHPHPAQPHAHAPPPQPPSYHHHVQHPAAQQPQHQHFVPSQLEAPFRPSPFMGYSMHGQEENQHLKRAPLYTEAHARSGQPPPNQSYHRDQQQQQHHHYQDSHGPAGRYNYAAKPIYEDSHEKQPPPGGNSLYNYYRSKK